MGRKIKIRRDGAWVPADEGSLDNVIQSTTVDKISASTTAPSSPTPGDIWFDTSALPEELAPSSIVWKETPTGAVNGTNTNFSTAQPYVSGSLQVFINGLAESSFVTESSPGSGGFTLTPAPLTGDNISVQYQVRVTATGNADTVDGYHANAIPTAGSIPVLGGDGTLPQAALKQVAFSAYSTHTNTDAVAQATFTHVPFDAELFDTHGWYNASTGYFTPLVAGQYQLNTFVGLNSVVDQATVHCAIRKNGTNLHWTRAKQSGSGECGGGLSVVVDANGTTDTFDVVIWTSGSATTIAGSQQNCWFNGAKVGV